MSNLVQWAAPNSQASLHSRVVLCHACLCHGARRSERVARESVDGDAHAHALISCKFMLGDGVRE